MNKQLAAVLFLSGCVGVSSQTNESTVADQLGAPNYVGSSVREEKKLSEDSVPLSLYDLERRAEKYASLQKEFETQGLVFGIVRGTLIGAVVGGEGGALVGAAFGGAMGVSVAKQVSARLIDEHRNYLLQRESIEAVISAARSDTAAIEHDVALIQAASSDIKALSLSNTTQTSRRVSAYRESASKVAKRILERQHSLLLMEALVEASGQTVSDLRAERLKQSALIEQLSSSDIAPFHYADSAK